MIKKLESKENPTSVQDKTFYMKKTEYPARVKRSLVISAHNQIGPWPFRPIPFRPITISAHNFNIDILFVYLLLYGLMNFNLFKGKSVWRFYFTKNVKKH